MTKKTHRTWSCLELNEFLVVVLLRIALCSFFFLVYSFVVIVCTMFDCSLCVVSNSECARVWFDLNWHTVWNLFESERISFLSFGSYVAWVVNVFFSHSWKLVYHVTGSLWINLLLNIHKTKKLKSNSSSKKYVVHA